MYFTLLIVSLIAYAIQGVLVGGLARKHDLLWVTTVRGLSLLVVMAPLALLVPMERWALVPAHLPQLALACFCALMANLAQTFAVRHLPMAIAQALAQGLSALFTLALEVLVGGGWPPPAQIACVAGILAGVGALGWITGSGVPLSATARPLLGVLGCVAFGCCMASALIPLGWVSRGVDSFFAAWAWEGGIGLVGLIALGGRAFGAGGRRPSWTVMGRVALCSSPTFLGTGAYTWATTMGSLTVAGGVLSMMMVATAVIARLVHGERMRPAQWAAIAWTCLCLVALGLVQGFERPVPVAGSQDEGTSVNHLEVRP